MTKELGTAAAGAPGQAPKPFRTYEDVVNDFMVAVACLEKVLLEMHERNDVLLSMEMVPKAKTGEATYFNYAIWKQTNAHMRLKLEYRVVEEAPQAASETSVNPTPEPKGEA